MQKACFLPKIEGNKLRFIICLEVWGRKVQPQSGLWALEVKATMKSNIHPEYHDITVIMSDGSEFKTRSTYGEEGASLRLDIDPKVHPAWTGGNTHLVDTGGRVGRFNKRFGNFGLKK